MASELILEIRSVCKSFVKARKSQSYSSLLRVLDNLDLIVERGKITALIGGNGAGKTTLFNVISRLIDSDSGEIYYYPEEQPISILKIKAYKIPRIGIGRLFQSSQVFEQMTIRQNLLLGFNYGDVELPFAKQIIPKKTQQTERNAIEKANSLILELFGEEHIFWTHRDNLAGQLSYGQKRLLELTRLLMGDYKLLLLDEPTAGINPALFEDIGTLLNKMVVSKGITIFLIEHNMKFVMKHAHVCHFMHHGRNHHFGTPSDVLGDVNVRRKYLGA
jgi:ABC-type branched-subunit amino acid transport system ATPase component